MAGQAACDHAITGSPIDGWWCVKCGDVERDGSSSAPFDIAPTDGIRRRWWRRLWPESDAT